MAEANNPQNAEQWYSFLSDKLPPVRLSMVKQLQRTLNKPSCSVIQLSKLIKADPLLCFHIALSAGRLHSEKQSEITSIDHAIGSLGLNKLAELINSLPTTRLNPASTAQKMYFRSVANSHHAATQAQQWLKECRGGMFAEESYLASLFYNLGHWMLWYFAPLQMSQIQILIREKKISPDMAETRILGCTVDGISKRLLTLWPVSSLARTALENSTPLNRQMIMQLHQRALSDPRLSGDQLRQLNHLTQQKFFPVKLSNLVALAASYGWGNETTLHLVDIINDYLRKELDYTVAFLHQNCALASRNYHVAGVLSPAAEMLMLDSDLSPSYRLTDTDRKLFDLPPLKQPPAKTPASSATTASAADNAVARNTANQAVETDKGKDVIIPSDTTPETEEKDSTRPPSPLADSDKPGNQAPAKHAARSVTSDGDFLNKDTYQQYLQRFNELGDYYSQSTPILTDLLTGLSNGLGMQRLALIILPPKSDTLKVVKAIGFEPGSALPQSTHIVKPNSLFSRLNEKPGCLLINQTNREQIKTMLPTTFRPFISDQSYLMMSLFAANRSVVIIYADRDNSQEGVLSFHHKKFKDLCSSAGRCLDHVSKLRAGAKK